jgi:hypothetical protein
MQACMRRRATVQDTTILVDSIGQKGIFDAFLHVLGIFSPSLWVTKQGMQLCMLLTSVLAWCALACRHMIAISLLSTLALTLFSACAHIFVGVY